MCRVSECETSVTALSNYYFRSVASFYCHTSATVSTKVELREYRIVATRHAQRKCDFCKTPPSPPPKKKNQNQNKINSKPATVYTDQTVCLGHTRTHTYPYVYREREREKKRERERLCVLVATCVCQIRRSDMPADTLEA